LAANRWLLAFLELDRELFAMAVMSRGNEFEETGVGR
jgi:hypothetical protein